MLSRKITYIIWRSNPGGIEVLIPSLIEHFGITQCSVFILRNINDTEQDVFNGLPIKKYYGSKNNLIMLIKLYLYIIKNKDNIYHLFNAGPLVLLAAKLAFAKNIIYHIHGTVYWGNKFEKIYLKLIWELALLKKNIFLANSDWSKQRFKDQVSNIQSIKVIYNPINSKRFNFKLKYNIYIPKNIMYAGRLVEGKNLFKWIDMAYFLLKKDKNLIFNIYGDGPLKKDLINYIQQKGLEQKVIIKGFIKNIESAYYENDLFIFLSEYESFGNVIVESILCGTPAVANNIPPMQEIFGDNPDFMIDINNNFKDSILKIIMNYPTLLERTKILTKEFRTKFSYSNHFRELNNIYEQFYK